MGQLPKPPGQTSREVALSSTESKSLLWVGAKTPRRSARAV